MSLGRSIDFMNISLTPDLQKFVHDKVQSGLYTSASEVIRESLRLLNTYDELHKKRLKDLNQAINEGMVQLEKGQGIEADKIYRRLKKKITSASKD
jgi:antitoxin ParD1/3/4